jgi:hypothetical protein
MDVSPELLWGGIGLGFSSMAIALRVVYTNGKNTAERIEQALGARITALEGALGVAQAALAETHSFERNTLLGLILDSTEAIHTAQRSGRNLGRIIEQLRTRYGDDVLRDVENARQHAAQVETHPLVKKQVDPPTEHHTPQEARWRKTT